MSPLPEGTHDQPKSSQIQLPRTIEHILFESEHLIFVKFYHASISQSEFILRDQFREYFNGGDIPEELTHGARLTTQEMEMWAPHRQRVQEILEWRPSQLPGAVEYLVKYHGFETPLWEPYPVGGHVKEGETSVGASYKVRLEGVFTTVVPTVQTILSAEDVKGFEKRRSFTATVHTTTLLPKEGTRVDALMAQGSDLDLDSVEIQSVEKVHDVFFFVCIFTLKDGSKHHVTLDHSTMLEHFAHEGFLYFLNTLSLIDEEQEAEMQMQRVAAVPVTHSTDAQGA